MQLNTVVKTIKRKSHRGDQSITTDQVTADIIACVNEAFRDVARMLPKQFFWKQGTPLSVTPGTQATPQLFSLAADCQEPIVFWFAINGAYYKLRKVNSDQEWLGGVWDVACTPNTPLFFREIGPDGSGNKQIEIFPMSNATFSLNYEYYRTKTSDLSVADLNSELPDLPDYIQDVVEKGALYYFLKGFDDAAGEIAKRDYEQAKLDYDAGDDLNADTLPSFRWNKRQYYLPGFRLNS